MFLIIEKYDSVLLPYAAITEVVNFESASSLIFTNTVKAIARDREGAIVVAENILPDMPITFEQINIPTEAQVAAELAALGIPYDPEQAA